MHGAWRSILRMRRPRPPLLRSISRYTLVSHVLFLLMVLSVPLVGMEIAESLRPLELLPNNRIAHRVVVGGGHVAMHGGGGEDADGAPGAAKRVVQIVIALRFGGA